ncbi:MAG: outer membrane beta-barrel protein [Acidobacteriota bacterium]
MLLRSSILIAGMATLLTAPSYGQSKFSFAVGGGPTVPGKHSGRNFNTGFNATAGVGYHPVRAFGVMAEFGFNNMNITGSALQRIGVPDGSGRIYSATLNPMVHLNPRGRFDVYLIGGGGYYRRTIEFTQPSSAIATGFDPFYGIFFPVEIPTTTVLGSYTQNKGGVNGGAGIAIRFGEDTRSSFFAESRYHYIWTSPVRTSMIPVTFGFRW